MRGFKGEVAKDGAVSSSVDLGEGLVHATLDDLVLALYVMIDHLLRLHPEHHRRDWEWQADVAPVETVATS